MPVPLIPNPYGSSPTESIPSTEPSTINARIIEYFDGDSYLLSPTAIPSLVLEARLLIFDCSETNKREKSNRGLPLSLSLAEQSQYRWGAVALQRVRELVTESANTITVQFWNRDLYKRYLISLILADGRLLGEPLIEEGLAVLYREKGTIPAQTIRWVGKDTINRLVAKETIARKERIGFWSDPNWRIPAEFRSQYRGKNR